MDNIRRVLDKQKADKKKQDLKRLLKKIDSESKGYVKSEVFFRLLQMEGIQLSQQSINKLTKECKPLQGG
jgi:Ca2+-binding EF-hand superfamily protein